MAPAGRAAPRLGASLRRPPISARLHLPPPMVHLAAYHCTESLTPLVSPPVGFSTTPAMPPTATSTSSAVSLWMVSLLISSFFVVVFLDMWSSQATGGPHARPKNEVGLRA